MHLSTCFVYFVCFDRLGVVDRLGVGPKAAWGSDQNESPNISMLSHKTGAFWLLNPPFGGQKGVFKNQKSEVEGPEK